MTDTLNTDSVLSPKGGVGKSLLAAILAYEAARRGEFVVLIDADVQPGVTGMFARHHELMTGQSGVLKEIERDPQRRTLIRLIAEPQRELDALGFEFPMPAGCAGKLVLIPNSGEFDTLLTELNRLYATDKTAHPDLALARALPQVNAARAAAGKRPVDRFIIDCPGERGQIARMVQNAASAIIIPMMPTALSLTATLNALDDVAATQARRRGLPLVKPVIINAIRTQRQQRFLAEKAIPALSARQTPVFTRQIPFNADYDDILNEGALPFESPDLADIQQVVAAYFAECVQAVRV